MSEAHQLEENIFAKALALPAAERSSYLAKACAGNATLLARLESLLREHDTAGAFLEVAPIQAMIAALRQELPPTEGPGTKIGRYQLVEKIGEGGCGVVYRAEQTEPVRRTVALKIIKLGMDTAAVIARFQAERQALSLMDHANIARALDAGATETGRPFFVMELVRGSRITRFCDEHRLRPAERLRLFIQVCHAVQHAHQKGVIHRDLKPSNVLVEMTAAGPVPKVIDFGIAKATQGRLTDQTLFTAFDQFMGTPAYMSPEQAEPGGLDIDTRSDTYSLGVLLYELLTGCTPLEAADLRLAAVEQVRRHLREAELPLPSARLRSLDSATLNTAAGRRQIGSSELIHLVSGDLDWIVMRCLERDRARRYETVNGLARDLERHLASEPVTARPPGALYLLGKFIRRHRLAFVAGGAVMIALLAGLVASTTLFFRERAARERAVLAEQAETRLRRLAEANEKKAATETARSVQAAQFMAEMLQGVGPGIALGRDTALLRGILDVTARRLDTELKEQPAVAADLRSTLGQVYFDLGEFAEAETMHRAALGLRRKIYGNENPKVIESLNALGEALRRHGPAAEAETVHREAISLQRKLLGNDDPALAQSLQWLARALRTEGKNEEALPLLQEALAIERKRFGPTDPLTMGVMVTLGAVYQRQARYVEAEAATREVLSANPRTAGTIGVVYQFGSILLLRGKLTEAETYLRQAVALGKKTENPENPETGLALSNLSKVLAEQGRYAEAEATLRENLAQLRILVARKSGTREFDTNLAYGLRHLGDLLNRQGRYAEAEAALREAISWRRPGRSTSEPPELSECLADLGCALAGQEKFTEAEAAYREALALNETLLDHRIYLIASGLPRALERAGKSPESAAAWEEMITISRKATAAHAGDPADSFAFFLLAAMVENGQFARAETFASENHTRAEKARPGQWPVFAFQAELGGALAGQKKFAAAEPLLLSACAGLQQTFDSLPVYAGDKINFAYRQIERLYVDWGQPEQAAVWRQKHQEITPGVKP